MIDESIAPLQEKETGSSNEIKQKPPFKKILLPALILLFIIFFILAWLIWNRQKGPLPAPPIKTKEAEIFVQQGATVTPPPPPRAKIDAFTSYMPSPNLRKVYIYAGDRVWHYTCDKAGGPNTHCTASYTNTLSGSFGGIVNPTPTKYPPLPTDKIDAISSYIDPADNKTTYGEVYKDNKIWRYSCNQPGGAGTVCTVISTNTLEGQYRTIANRQTAWGQNQPPITKIDAFTSYMPSPNLRKVYIYAGNRMWHYTCNKAGGPRTTCKAEYTTSLTDAWKNIRDPGHFLTANPLPTSDINAISSYIDPTDNKTTYGEVYKADRIWRYSCNQPGGAGTVCTMISTNTLEKQYEFITNKASAWGIKTFISKKRGVAVPAWVEAGAGFSGSGPTPTGYMRRPANYLRDVKNIYNKLGATWHYNWGNYYANDRGHFFSTIRPDMEKASCSNNVEFVPMIGRKTPPTWNPKPTDPDPNILYAKAHPGSYWLIWNEPNVSVQANMSPADAALEYDKVRNVIKTADPSAKLIVGGVLFRNDNVPPAIIPAKEWLTRFVDAYKNTHNQKSPDLDGIHVHFYADYHFHNCSKTPMENLKFRMEDIISWLSANYPGKELWVTEFGALNSGSYCNPPRPPVDVASFINDAVNYFERNSAVKRYAVFASWYPPPDSRLFRDDNASSVVLTPLGDNYRLLTSSTISEKILYEVCGNRIDDDCDGAIDEGC